MKNLLNLIPLGTQVRHRLTNEVGIVTSSGPFHVNVVVMQEQHLFVLGQWVVGNAQVGKRWRVPLVERFQAERGLVLGEIR